MLAYKPAFAAAHKLSNIGTHRAAIRSTICRAYQSAERLSQCPALITAISTAWFSAHRATIFATNSVAFIHSEHRAVRAAHGRALSAAVHPTQQAAHVKAHRSALESTDQPHNAAHVAAYADPHHGPDERWLSGLLRRRSGRLS